MNEQNEYGWYPLLYATSYNNIEIVQILINYAYVNKNKINLKLNKKDRNGYYPLLYTISFNNIEMVKL